MDKTAIIVSSVVGSLGLLSAILGFAGEGANATYSTPGLGICAGIFLLIAQITLSAVGGCCGCCASRAIPSETKRIVGIVSAVGSWVTAVIACVLFFVFAAVSVGILAGAAVLTLVATALNITSVIMMQPADAATAPVVVPVVVQVQPVVDDQEKVVTTKAIPATQSEKNGQAQNSENPPPPTAQDKAGTHAQNQQFSPEGRSADAAQPSSTAGAEPADQSAPRAVAMPQPQVPPPQPHAQLQQLPPANVTPQYYTAVQAPHLDQVHVEAAPGRISSSSTTATPTGNGPTLRTTIRNEFAKATIRFTEKAVEHVLFSNNNNATGDVLLSSMVTDPTVGADVGATDCGDSAV